MEVPFDPLDPRWKEWIAAHADEPVAELALRYAGKGLPLESLLNQIKGRKISKNKLPTWHHTPGILYPDALILEQCSSEATAHYKGEFARQKQVIDLSGGLGVDSWAMASTAQSLITCEPDPIRVQAMEMNFNRLGLRNTKVICTTAEDALAKQLDHGCSLLYLDPARRSGEGKRVYRLNELQPDVTALKSRLLQHAEHVVLKLAPMLDIQEGIRQLPETYRIDVLSWKGECRELLFHLRKDPGDVIDIHATELESTLPAFGFQLLEERSGRNAPVSAPGTLLFEPHAALRKSGARASICERFGLSVLHANTLLFTGHQDQPDFPGTRWNLSETLPYKPKMLRERFQAHGARMVFYNFPETPEQVMATLKLRSHSDHSLFFVRLNDGKAAVLYAQRMND